MLDKEILLKIVARYMVVNGITDKDEIAIHVPIVAIFLSFFNQRLKNRGSYREKFKKLLGESEFTNEWSLVLSDVFDDFVKDMSLDAERIEKLTKVIAHITLALHQLAQIREMRVSMIYQLQAKHR